MGSRRKRTIRYILAGAAILVAVIVFLFIVLQSKDVDMPNDNATPEQVVDGRGTPKLVLLVGAQFAGVSVAHLR